MIKIINKRLLNKLYKAIKSYDEIVIARHVGPDPDAIGSEIALRDSIRLTFPDKKVYAVGLSVSRFKSYGILDRPNYEELNKPLLIVLDVPNMARIDGIENLKYDEILKIDHHPKEDIKAKFEWIDETKSSTCQMVTEFILYTKLKLDQKIAENLFLGIASDSERFSLKNTTYETFETVKELIKQSKIDFTNLYDILYTRPMSEHKFIAYITNNIIIDENKLGYIKINDNILKEFKVDASTPSNLINNFNFIEEMLVWIFITEDVKNKQYKISVRSRGPIINTIVSKYNGGGHKFACGARLDNMESIDNLIKELSEACKEYENTLLQE